MPVMPEPSRLNVKGPLSDGVLKCSRLVATEELGRLFRIDLELFSGEESVNFDDVLGGTLTVRASVARREFRYFNGYVCQFSQEPRSGNYSRYRATLRPWLWFLTRTADCRIFQQKSVPDIVKEVFREHGFSDFEEKLKVKYLPRDYCVQYRETDFAFVSRLLEEEGIYYYFAHDDGKHTLVLADDYGSHTPIEGLDTIPYLPPSDNAVRERHINHWRIDCGVQAGAVALTDYDFEKPNVDLATAKSVPRGYPRSEYEVFDYPGGYREVEDGGVYARVRVEELQAQHEQLRGKGDVLTLATGGLFQLTGHPRDDQNREYLVLQAEHTLEGEEAETGGAAPGGQTNCTFTVADSRTPFRPRRATPRPVVQGPQTAVVVGKQGEEIWTDKYGRIKVQFHWDRNGKMDENSSCWVRVAQVWAGKSWGTLHLPRVGQEVIVEFLEGDPDRPIVTGRVYNADQMPPYTLPDNATQSGVVTRSSKGGDPKTANEIRFEDKEGQEHLLIHAEKDMSVEVENNQEITVGKDKWDKGNRTLFVENDETITIGGDNGDGNRTATLKGDDTLTVGKEYTLDAGDKLTLKCGGSEIVMSADGIEIKTGGTFDVSSTGAANLKSSADLKLKGLSVEAAADTTATLKGNATAELSSSGQTTVKGSMVMIN